MTAHGATVSIRVPTALRRFTEDRAVVTVETDDRAPTIATVLDALAQTCPGVVDRVVDERGNVRRHVNVFVGPDEIRTLGGLAAPVADGAEVSILPAVSGG